MNRFLKPILLALALGSSGPAFAEGASETTYHFEGIDRLQVESGIQVEVRRGPLTVQRLTTGTNSRLRVEQRGSTLELGFQFSFWSLWGHRTERFVITLPELRSLRLSGGAQAKVDWQPGPDQDLDLEVEGGAGIDGVLKVGRLDARLSGGAHATVSGSASPVRIEASGGAWFRSPSFTATDTELDLTGGGGAVLELVGRARVDASGGARLEYSGDPQLRQNTSGGASVHHRG